MSKIDPKFSQELKKYGAKNLNACFNCGNCTAVCSLSTEDDSFPREMVRYSTLGLQSDIKSSLKPWLCYYCGECSETCPQEANPGELMMTLRRWLTAKYDWTGLSGIFYRSLPATIFAFALVIIGVISFSVYKNYDQEVIMHFGHLFEIIAISAVFLVVLFPNIIRMWWFTMYKPKINAPLKTYYKQFKELIIHMFTQKRTRDCEDNNFRWLEHLVLVIGYLALLFTTVALNWFGTSSLFIIILGYIESAIIFIVTFDFIIRRFKKDKEISKFSQPSDWFFVIWLFLMGLTAFAVRVSIDTNLLGNNLWIYLIHLIILIQWAVIIVPFGKWTHFLYRSFAMYFYKVKGVA